MRESDTFGVNMKYNLVAQQKDVPSALILAVKAQLEWVTRLRAYPTTGVNTHVLQSNCRERTWISRKLASAHGTHTQES